MQTRLVVLMALTVVTLVAAAPASAQAGPCSNPVAGGTDDDRFSGDAGNDRFHGQRGEDDLDGRAGSDCLLGGRGDDDLSGGTGRDRLDGGNGRDRLDGGGGRDQLDAGPGNDIVRTRDGVADQVNCGAGNDVIVADGIDQLSGCERPRRKLGATKDSVDGYESAIFNTVVGKLTDKASDAALAWLSNETGLRLPGKDAAAANAQFAYIRDQLGRLNTAIGDLKTTVLQGQAETWQSTVAASAANVDTAAALLATILDPKTSTATAREKRAQLLSLVKAKQLEHAVPELQRLLAGGPGYGPGIVNKAYEVVRNRRYFTRGHSVSVRRLFDDYALIQAKNLWVLKWYWLGTGQFFDSPIKANPRPGEGAIKPSAVESYVSEQTAAIARQRDQLLSRFVVPDYSILDLHSSYLWNWTDNTYDRREAGAMRVIGQGATEFRFVLPSNSDFDILMQGYAGTPGNWLRNQGWGTMPGPQGRRFFWTDRPIYEYTECLRRVLVWCVEEHTNTRGQVREIQADHAVPGSIWEISIGDYKGGLWRGGVNTADFVRKRG
jgi:hypothetical protein